VYFLWEDRTVPLQEGSGQFKPTITLLAPGRVDLRPAGMSLFIATQAPQALENTLPLVVFHPAGSAMRQVALPPGRRRRAPRTGVMPKFLAVWTSSTAAAREFTSVSPREL
jgi:hypothetical protein